MPHENTEDNCSAFHSKSLSGKIKKKSSNSDL